MSEHKDSLDEILTDFGRWVAKLGGTNIMRAGVGVTTLEEAKSAITDLMTEWRDILGYENIYQVSNFGDVSSYRRQGATGGILLKTTDSQGYSRVTLFSGNKKSVFVHRLVAEAFLPNHHNKPQVNHIDGVKTNNNVRNLEWATGKENSQHAHALGLSKATRGNSKLTNEDIQDIRLFASKGIKQKDIAQLYPVNRQSISLIVNNLTWRNV